MIIGITGGRRVRATRSSTDAMIAWCIRRGVTVVRHGDCETGVDPDVAEELDFAFIPGLLVDPWPALWSPGERRAGDPAGPRRNAYMVSGDRSDWGLPREPPIERLIAWPGGSGTASCRAAAHRFRVKIIEIAEIEAWHRRVRGNR